MLRLRNILEPNRDGSPVLLVTDGSGYRLNVTDDAIDARRFERLVELGRRALQEGKAEAAAATLGDALKLWRGPAYTGLESTAFGGREARRLEELRLEHSKDRTQLVARCSAAAAAATIIAGLAAFPATARPDPGDPIPVKFPPTTTACSSASVRSWSLATTSPVRACLPRLDTGI